MIKKMLRAMALPLFLLIVALGGASCQLIDDVNPAAAPPAVEDQPTSNSADESPRLRNAGEIPPTWTPPANPESETPISPAEVAPGGSSQKGSYVVQPGDSLAAIALRFNVSIEELARVNDIGDIDHIEVGQVLVIPGL